MIVVPMRTTLNGLWLERNAWSDDVGTFCFCFLGLVTYEVFTFPEHRTSPKVSKNVLLLPTTFLALPHLGLPESFGSGIFCSMESETQSLSTSRNDGFQPSVSEFTLAQQDCISGLSSYQGAGSVSDLPW